MRIQDLHLGQSAERTRMISDGDVRAYADLVGDHNPIHIDEEYARGTRFGGRIAHGMLVGGLISTALATDLPGPGTIYLSQTLKFLRPVKIGDSVTVRVEVLEILEAKQRCRLSTTCRNQNGEVVAEGEASVLVTGGY